MTARVGVQPAEAASERPRLLQALEDILPVRFEPVGAGERVQRSLHAVIRFGHLSGPSAEDSQVPVLSLVGDRAGKRRETVYLGQDPSLDERLHHLRLPNEEVVELSSRVAYPSAVIMARLAEAPVWIRTRNADMVGADLWELGERERLRDRIGPSSALAVLATLHFLRTVLGYERKERPACATIIVDDPNLHWKTYGHIRFAEVAAHAREFNYHLNFATVPFDMRFSHHGTVKLFRSFPELSLSIHGNDHARRELGVIDSESEASRVLAQALRRTGAFERRTGLKVARVLVPPHEALSAAVASQIHRFQFDGVTLTDPRRLMDKTRAREYRASGFTPATMLGSAPTIVRRGVDELVDTVLRVYLDQPVILYAHELDFREGYDSLAAAASTLNQNLGARWLDPSGVARANYEALLLGDELHVTPWSRAVDIVVPREAMTVRLFPQGASGGATRHLVVSADGPGELRVRDDVTTVMKLSNGASPVLRVRLESENAAGPDTVQKRWTRPDHALRRLGAETRDRGRALIPAR